MITTAVGSAYVVSHLFWPTGSVNSEDNPDAAPGAGVGHLGIHPDNIDSFMVMADLLNKATGGWRTHDVDSVEGVLGNLGDDLNYIGFSGPDIDIAMPCVPKVQKTASTDVIPICREYASHDTRLFCTIILLRREGA